jgi:hypothetical protein
MEPGMLPTVLGVILVGLGLLILISALIAPAVRADDPPVQLRPFLAIILATAAFALSVGPLGVLPAVVAATVIACLADTRLSVVGALALGGALAILVVLAFRIALGLPLTLARWPFS